MVYSFSSLYLVGRYLLGIKAMLVCRPRAFWLWSAAWARIPLKHPPALHKALHLQA